MATPTSPAPAPAPLPTEPKGKRKPRRQRPPQTQREESRTEPPLTAEEREFRERFFPPTSKLTEAEKDWGARFFCQFGRMLDGYAVVVALEEADKQARSKRGGQ